MNELSDRRIKRRLAVAERIDTATPLCWAQLYSWAVNPGERLLIEIDTTGCAEESKRLGYCWCGKFEKGVRQARPS